MLTAKQQQLLVDLRRHGQIVWIGGSQWRCVGKNGEAGPVYQHRVFDRLIYTGRFEPVEWRKNQAGDRRPIVYRLSPDYQER